MKKLFKALFTLLVCMMVFAFAAHAADEIIFTMPSMPLDIENAGGRSIDKSKSNEEETIFKVNGKINGQGPALFFYDLDIDADSYDYIRMVAKIDLEEDNVKNHAFLFQTEDLGFSEDRRAYIAINHESDGYVEYIFDFSKHPQWKGKITSVYYGLYGDAKGEIRIKSLEFVDGIPEEITSGGNADVSSEPENSEGEKVNFTMPPEPIDMENAGGRSIDKAKSDEEETVFKINGNLNGQGPALFFYDLNIDADSYDYIRMVAKIDLEEDNVKNHAFLFQTEDLGFSEDRRAYITINHESDGYVEYIFDFSKHPQWNGKITSVYYGLYGDAKGEIRIKSLEFVDGIPEEITSGGNAGVSSEPEKSEGAEVDFTMPPEPVDMSNLGGRSIDKASSNSEETVFKVNGNLNGQAPALFFYDLNIDADTYDYIRMVAVTDYDNKDVKNHAILFQTEKAGFSEDRKATVAIDHESEGYVEYIFDFRNHPEWKGKVTALYYGIYGDTKGELRIKTLELIDEPEDTSADNMKLTDEEIITDIKTEENKPTPSRFVKTREYTDSFTDVPFTEWFYDAVVSAYEFGLVNGSSETTFEPSGTMTVAEAITLACRMYATASEKTINVKNGEVNWYDGYVEYAKNAGFLKDADFDSYDREIKRYEMVTLFAKALPESCFEELNYVTHIPDVASDASYAKAVYMFYNAGICMGNDIYGTFNPDSNIIRAEVAAIADRIANPFHRLDKELAVKNDPRDAYYILNDSSYTTRNSLSDTLQSGWNYDIRGGIVKNDDKPPYDLSDVSDKEPVTLTRPLTVQDAGVVTLVSSVHFNSGVNGWYAELNSSSGVQTAKIFTENNSVFAVDNGTAKQIDKIVLKNGSNFSYEVSVDLGKRAYTVYIDGMNCGTYGLANAYASDIAELKIGTTEEAVMDTTLGVSSIYCNYLVNDHASNGGTVRADWTVTATGDVTVKSQQSEYLFEGNSGKVTASNTFKKTSGTVVFEFIMHDPELAGNMSFALTSGGSNVATFKTLGGKMYAGSKELRTYKGNMWYMVRITADTNTKTAEFKVSGKTVAKDVPFEFDCNFIDGVMISAENLGGKKVKLDNIRAFEIPYHEDYPSEPVVPDGADDYYIGINVCNLWRNGYHWGWDNISAYDDIKPYLGWYDEGLSEVADWEIKFMVEHGIDFQLLCWYHTDDTPFKDFFGSSPNALFYGFMNAKYSDEYGKFALLWEAQSGTKPQNISDFKSRFVEFWMEYFFTDPRYMVIDNKPVMSIFGIESLYPTLGKDGVKEAFDYLRAEIKKLGYDDLIIMACYSNADPAILKEYADIGVDAVHAYNWGVDGAYASKNQEHISEQQIAGNGIIHNVPTVSTGFNNVAWSYARRPLISPENLEQALTWVRDYALDKFETTGNGDKWKNNFVMLSTWNEYGEGTYMMPSGLNGFGYLDAVRDVFTKGSSHTDERPDNIQVSRLQRIYPNNREIIRPDGYYVKPFSSIVAVEDYAVKDGKFAWNLSNCVVDAGDDGLLHGLATNSDPMLFWNIPGGSFEAAGVRQVALFVEGVVGDSVQVYWTTTEDKAWTASKGTGTVITEEGLHMVVVDVSSIPTWKGTINGLRIDPITSQDAFKVEKLQLLGEEASESFAINNNIVTFYYDPVKLENGDSLVPFFPESGIGYSLGCAYTWDKVNKKLTLAKNGNTIVYTMDSDTVVINGEKINLGYKVYLEDGLPMIPIKYTAEKLGCTANTYEKDGAMVYNINSADEKTSEVLASRQPEKWEFDLNGDSEGWSLASATATVIAGSFIGNNNYMQTGWGGRYDPALHSPSLSFESGNYKTLKIRMKHEIAVEKTDENKDEFQMVIYFASSAGWISEDRKFRLPLEQSSNGEFIEYVIPLEHKDWTGKISYLRIDPYNNVPGQFEIDYIRFE